ncbi:MAG: methyltransferase [Novosphingobium sp.]|nr:methyltransferase [Novosphingobium sp.]
MPAKAPPMIFAPKRWIAARRRMRALQARPDAPRYLINDMIEDVIERAGFLRVEFRRGLIIGDWGYDGFERLAEIGRQDCTLDHADPLEGFNEEQPFDDSDRELVLSLGTLDTVNDLPGALIHIHNALAPGGLMIASFLGSGSLPVLREAMLVADGDRPAPRIHPQVDVRAGGQLLQRAGFADPVVDSRSLDVSFRSLDGLVADLRAQGLSNVLADPGPPLGKAALERARAAFYAAGENGRTVERFEILTLSGWKR